MRAFNLDGNRDPPRVSEHTRTHPRSEWELEDLLNANPDLLLNENLLLFGRQYRLESGILDLLALDQFGNTVIFEVKRGESGSGSASEETILSQPQNYAQSISTYDYDDLNNIYQEYRTADWFTSPTIMTSETLEEAFEMVFGTSLETDTYNEHQRMVIVAENITQRTAANTRYLLEKGLNIQCLEIQKFEGANNQSTIATKSVVDYGLNRVQPKREGSPTYPDVAKDLAERSFSELNHLVDANTYHEAFENLNGYQPSFRSTEQSHPDSIRYVYHLRPLKWGSVGVALHIDGGDEDALRTVRKYAAEFEDNGFKPSPTRKRDRVVRQFWDVDSPSRLSNEEFKEELVDRFVTLVQTGHDIFRIANNDGFTT